MSKMPFRKPFRKKSLFPKRILQKKAVITGKQINLHGCQLLDNTCQFNKPDFTKLGNPSISKTVRNKFFIKRSVLFYKNKLDIVGPILSKVSHLRFLYHFNWKLFRNRRDDSFALLDSSKLRLRKKYSYTKRGYHRQGWVYRYSVKYYLRFGNTRRNVKFKNTKLFLVKKTLPSINYQLSTKFRVSLFSVRKLPSLHIFKKKYLWGKPLVFTNSSGRSFGKTTNINDILLTSKIQFMKRKNVSRNLRKGKKNLRINSKFSRMSSQIFRNLPRSPKIPHSKLVKPCILGVSKAQTLLNSITPISQSNTNFIRVINNSFLGGAVVKIATYDNLPTSKFVRFFKALDTLVSGNGGFKLRAANKIAIITRSKLNLTFTNLSMFLVSKNFINPYLVNTRKYIWRKKINSFIYPNEYRRSLFFRKRKTFINSIFTNYSNYFSNFSKSGHAFSVTKLLTRESLAIYNKASSGRSRYTVPTDSSTSSTYRWSMTHRECHITRVRFKPGYQNLWRRVRGALKDYLGLRYIYQKQLTKHLTGFYISSSKYLWGCSEMSIFRTVLYSRLLPDNSAFNLFWDEKLIFLNGVLPSNKNTILAAGDLIQLVISLNYYITYRWLVSLTKERHRNMRKLVYRKGLARKYKLIKQRKQKSHYTPSWIYKNRFDFSDVKNFLEVDYFTLSAIVLYTPYMLSYHAYDNQLDLKINTFRLYNWKYIT